MMTIVWDPTNTLLELGSFFTLKWYNLLFAISFLIALPLWRYMCMSAGKDSREAEKIQIYIVIGVLLGARLGHFLFYDWSTLSSNLVEVLLPFEFNPTFRIVGFSGLASHGAVCGVVLAIFFYVKRIHIIASFPYISITDRKPKGEFIWILDHLVILIALAGSLVRIGNFTNSEIIGKPTDSACGVVFVKDVREYLHYQYYPLIQQISFQKGVEPPIKINKRYYQPIQLTLTFQKDIKEEKLIHDFLQGKLKKSLVCMSHNDSAMIYESYGTPLRYRLTEGVAVKNHQAIIDTLGIPRHPAQLYESFSCLLLFILLVGWWAIKGQAIPAGHLTGVFAVVVFSLRFVYEFYKEHQVYFENKLWFNMGQFLSLPLIVLGIWLIIRPFWHSALQKK